MDPKDKIDLRSLNKTKKQIKLPRPTNLFKKKSAGPGRDSAGRFAPTGFKLKNKWFNRKSLTAVVILIAVIGGFYVYRSNASTGDVFSKSASQLTGGKLTSKSDGKQYRFNNTSDISTTLTLAQMNSTKQFCAYVKTLADSYVFITVTTTPADKPNNTVLTRAKTTLVPKDKGTEVCTTTVTNVSNTVSGGKVTVGTAKFDSSGKFVANVKSAVAVEKIYGRSETTLPTVAITAPLNNATVSGGAVNLAATATDNLGVSKVEFKIGSTLVGTDTTSPYSYSWNSTTRSNGSYTLSATAYDVAGNSKTTSIAITVSNALDTTLPTVSITSPVAVAPSTIPYVAGSAVKLAATATDNIGVTKVEFIINTDVIYTDTTYPYSYSWDSTIFSDYVTKALTVKAYDAAGNSNRAVLTMVVDNSDNTKPTASITSPAGLLVPDEPSLTAPVSGSSVNLAVSATDNIGVSKVEFKMNNVTINTDTTAPYSFAWNSKSVNDGQHLLTVVVRDAAGNSETKSLGLRVNNSGKIKIVFAGANYSSNVASFDSWVTTQIGILSRTKPYDKYLDRISFRSVNVGSVPCWASNLTSDGRAWVCDYAVVSQKLAEAGVSYDKVLVVNNSTVYGGTASNDFATANGMSDYTQQVGTHELSHTFGLDDEYVKYNTTPAAFEKYSNCYDGRTANPYFVGITTNQMFIGCAAPGWYRSADISTMSSVLSNTFSPAALKLMDYSLGLYLK